MTEHVGIGTQGVAARSPARGMLIRATLAQNVGTGSAFGGLGVSVLALQDRFQASLGTATMGLSLTVLSMTAIGPLIAGLISRHGLRAVMSTGVLLSLLGYLGLAYAPSMAFALAACGLLIGPGAALFAALPPAVLAGGWYPHARGRVMGVAYLPLFVTIIPLIGVSVLQQYGLTIFYLGIAALHLLLLPLMLGVIDPPHETADEQDMLAEQIPGSSVGVILGAAVFWLITLGDGILNGTAIVGSAHMLPIVEEYGASVETGAVLLSISGASSILGSLLAGYACDRVGSAKTLGFAGLGFAISWALIAATGWLPSLAVAAFLMGLCGASVFPPISALAVEIFGIDALPRVLGFLGLGTIPFTFAMSPAAGWLRDAVGNYGPVYAGLIGACLLAAVTFFGIDRSRSRNSRVESMDATMPLSSNSPA